MTKRRPLHKDRLITPMAVDLYKRARKIYDECDSEYQTEALKACDGLCDKLEALLGRTKPWRVEIFATIDIDQPADWQNAEDWHEAKQILTALEEAAA
jgi:hypothetical protein